jgi:hypothetical protein
VVAGVSVAANRRVSGEPTRLVHAYDASVPWVSADIWGDESGNLDFDQRTGSRFFVVSTLAIRDSSAIHSLLNLRRDLDHSGFKLPEGFHASEDRQVVRDNVFQVLTSLDLRADITYYTKANAYPRVKDDPDYFYKFAWYYHLRYVLPRRCPKDGSIFVAIATLGTKRRRELHAQALGDVVKQCLGSVRAHCAHWTAQSHPCLQAADYYCWAVQRWLENGDRRSLDLIQPQIETLHRLF